MGQLVQPGGEALGQAPGVHEDERRAVLLHELEQPRVHRWPDAAAHRTERRRAADRLLDDLAEVANVLDRDDDLDVELLADAGVGDVDLAPRAGGVTTGGELGDLLQRPLRGRQADALRATRLENGRDTSELQSLMRILLAVFCLK